MVQRLHPISARRSQKGFNLIEAAIVLGVVGLVIGGIWVAASAVSRQHRAQQTLDGFLFIGEKLNQVYGKTTPGETYCSPVVCFDTLTPQQLQSMLGTPPAGWQFNADGTLDSPIFSGVHVDVIAWFNGDYKNTVTIQSATPGTNDEAACKTFGTLALKSFATKAVLWVEIGSNDYRAGGDSTQIQTENSVYADLDNGFTFSGIGQVDPLWAGGVGGCNYANIAIARP